MSRSRPSLAAACALLAGLATAAPSARAAEVTVPADVGFGPALHWITGKVADDQLFHYGLKLNVYAVIDQATLQANKDRIPKRYRKALSNVREIRYTPSIFIPDTLIISPKIDDTQMYGISWAPFQLGFKPLIEPIRVAFDAAVRLTYLFIDSDTLGTTHFLRPGLDLVFDLEIPFSDSFLISLGWTSTFYIPQRLDGGVFDTGPFDDSVWHIGQANLKFHIRFPYTTDL